MRVPVGQKSFLSFYNVMLQRVSYGPCYHIIIQPTVFIKTHNEADIKEIFSEERKNSF